MEKQEMFMSLALSLLLLPACQHRQRPIFFDDIDDAIEDCKLPKLNDPTARTLRNQDCYEEEMVRYDDEEYYWEDRGGEYKKKVATLNA